MCYRHDQVHPREAHRKILKYSYVSFICSEDIALIRSVNSHIADTPAALMSHAYSWRRLVGNLPRSPSQFHVTLFARVERPCKLSLIHLSDQSVDELFSITKITTLDEMSELAWSETASGVGQLKWPQEVGGLLEVGANGEDLHVRLGFARVSQDEYNIPRGSSLRYRQCRIDQGTPR
jgi:hypothetical protein